MKFLSFLFMLLSAAAFAETSVIPPVACTHPDKSFRSFLNAFAENKQFQRTRVLVPLLARYGEYSVNGAQLGILGGSELEKLSYPLFRSANERKSNGVIQDVVLLTKRYAEVFHGQNDADSDRVLYKFRNIDGCWYLEEFHDKAL